MQGPGPEVVGLLNQLRQRPQAVRVVDYDVVRSGPENAVILKAAQAARQNLGGGAALGGNEVAGLRPVNKR